MKQVKINLDTFDKVHEFNFIINRYGDDVELLSNQYIVNAKSLMGIYSLDLSKPLMIQIHEDANKADELIKELDSFLAE